MMHSARRKTVHFRTVPLSCSISPAVQSSRLLFNSEDHMATLHKKLQKKSPFNAQAFLESVGASRRIAEFRRQQIIFSQGDAADSVMYVQRGSVKFTVVNESGKEAVVAIFGPGDFFGEGGGSDIADGDGDSN